MKDNVLDELSGEKCREAVFGIPKLVVRGKLLSEGNEYLGSMPAKIQLLVAVE